MTVIPTPELLTAAIDSMDPEQFGKLLSEDSIFVFGNFPAAEGKAAVRQAQIDFFASIKAVKHTVVRSWTDGNSIAAEMTVTYTRHDDSIITLPVTDVFTLRDGLVTGTYIYMDIAPLYTPAAA